MKLKRNKKDGRSETKTVAETSKIKLPPWKVLIVDDEPDIHSMTQMALTRTKPNSLPKNCTPLCVLP